MSKKKILKITQIKYLKNYILQIYFEDKKIVKIDFESFIKHSQHPEILKYKKLSNFKKYKLIDGELMWGDFDLIFPILDLYKNNIHSKRLPNKKSKIV